jgi:hypothetical protein
VIVGCIENILSEGDITKLLCISVFFKLLPAFINLIISADPLDTNSENSLIISCLGGPNKNISSCKKSINSSSICSNELINLSLYGSFSSYNIVLYELGIPSNFSLIIKKSSSN